MRIDAHQHFWRYSATEYPWIDTRMAKIARDFLPSHLEPVLAAAGIDGCIAVQVRSSMQENDFLLGLAAQHAIVKGVVGWADLCAANAADVVAALARNGKLRGLRHIVQAEPDDFLLRPDFQRGVRTLAAHGLAYDVLVYPRQMQAAVAFARALPGQTLVLDHLAKPDIANRVREPWSQQLRDLAQQPHVSCKLSGMVTEAVWNTWRADDFTFYLDSALAEFGEHRVMFGSDWPVCLVAADSYARVHDLVADWAERLGSDTRNRLFGDNATRIYGLS